MQIVAHIVQLGFDCDLWRLLSVFFIRYRLYYNMFFTRQNSDSFSSCSMQPSCFSIKLSISGGGAVADAVGHSFPLFAIEPVNGCSFKGGAVLYDPYGGSFRNDPYLSDGLLPNVLGMNFEMSAIIGRSTTSVSSESSCLR